MQLIWLDNIRKTASITHNTVHGDGTSKHDSHSLHPDVLLYRKLATLRTDAPVFENVEELRWTGPTDKFEAFCTRLKTPYLYKKTMAVTKAP